MAVRWNTDKQHRCPTCHAVAVSTEAPSSTRVYTCCRCATRFTRWPRVARLLPEAGICCGEHTTVRDGILDQALQVIADPGYRAKGLGWESARDAVQHLLNGTHPSQVPDADEPVPEPPCTGFHWIGQPFYCCDNCSRPAWEHEGMHVFDPGSGPFGFDPGRTEPWEPGEADKIREKWEASWHVANGCSHLGKWAHGPSCPAPASVSAAGQDGGDT